MVPIINCGTSFYAGFVIFSSLGFMAHAKGVSVADVATGGRFLCPCPIKFGLTFYVVQSTMSIKVNSDIENGMTHSLSM